MRDFESGLRGDLYRRNRAFSQLANVSGFMRGIQLKGQAFLISPCRKQVTACRRSSTFVPPSKSCICRDALRFEQIQKTAKRLFENLSERVCGCLRRLRSGLQKLEIRDYALKSAGGLSEAKTSCPLLISARSIVPDFLVFAATELGAEVTPTHALNTSSIYCFGVFVRFTQSKAPRQIQI